MLLIALYKQIKRRMHFLDSFNRTSCESFAVVNFFPFLFETIQVFSACLMVNLIHRPSCLFLVSRERTVVYLISLGASPGALTDPTPTYPMGRTSADLASENGHKGISGFLAESALSAHLKCLTLKEKLKQDSAVDSPGMTSVLTASERVPTQVSSGDDHGLSLKDSLAALCNATQAAARIHQVYRSHSFKRKQMREFGNDKMESEEYALSVITLKSHKQVHHDEPVHAAAIRIQNKFRGWKGRKEFLTLRQQIVKIQVSNLFLHLFLCSLLCKYSIANIFNYVLVRMIDHRELIL